MSASGAEVHPLVARRASGVLLHLSSLPGGHGIGDLGASATRAVEWLALAGQRFWQMLPVGPIGAGNSPYSSPSAFAGEPLFVALDPLVREGLLPRSALAAPKSLGRGMTQYDAAAAFKRPRFLAAFMEFVERGLDRGADYRSFVRRSRSWLSDWCLFAAERDGGDVDFHAFLQYQFDRQWRALRSFAAKRGVRLIGDVPIFVGLDSADVQAHPELFRLRRDGSPEVLTGVPPDSFSKTGQLWGQPHYRWSVHRRNGFAWWTRRFERAMDLFDLVRIDHFIGFHNAYEVPGAAKTAERGAWKRTPGRELLSAVRRALGSLPLIAEDLGHLTPPVHALRDEFGLPGMRIVQNAFYRDGSSDLPCMHPARSVAYPGTHDNHVTSGWWRALPADARRRYRAYVGATREPVWSSMLRITMQSSANIAIVQLQDAIGLGPSSRMNLPGTPRGNWTWRAEAAMLSRSAALRLRALTTSTGRLVSDAEPRRNGSR
ncbi:MAG: 4-alpha-glucanotransferase [Phycisphaerales bacterium]